MSGIGFGPAYGGGSNVISVAGRTGAVTLTVADVTSAADSSAMTDWRMPIAIVPTVVSAGAPAAVYANPGLRTANRAASATTHLWSYELAAMVRDAASKGFKLTSIVIVYAVTTADLDDFTALLYTTVAPTTGNAVANGVNVPVTYDAAHDTTAERKAQGNHTMTLTVTTPAFLNAHEHVVLELSIDGDAGAASTFSIKMMEAVFTYAPLS